MLSSCRTAASYFTLSSDPSAECLLKLGNNGVGFGDEWPRLRRGQHVGTLETAHLVDKAFKGLHRARVLPFVDQRKRLLQVLEERIILSDIEPANGVAPSCATVPSAKLCSTVRVPTAAGILNTVP